MKMQIKKICKNNCTLFSKKKKLHGLEHLLSIQQSNNKPKCKYLDESIESSQKPWWLPQPTSPLWSIESLTTTKSYAS